MNNKEALEYIHSLCWMNPELGLDSTRELLSLLGNPEKGMKFIHIGGTNGKGSTSAMTAEILRESGLRVGLFTSPFIMRFNERIMVSTDGGKSDVLYGFREITDDELAELVTEIKAGIEKMTKVVSEFEAVTALGFLFFKRMKCDAVVLEVGMGGEYDATNVIEAPTVAALVNIGLDHTKILGETIAEIARTKSGIIKHGSKIVFYGENPEAQKEIEQRCKAEKCELRTPDFNKLHTISSDLYGQEFDYKNRLGLKMPMIGAYQQKNAAMTLEIVDCLLEKGFEISDRNITDGISKTSWLARLERLSENPLVFVDGSHNPQGMRATVNAIKEALDNTAKTFDKVICVFGVMADKDHAEIIDILSEIATEIIAVQPEYYRAMKHEDLYNEAKAVCKDKKVKVLKGGTVKAGIRKGLSRADENSLMLCLGSLYMAGEVRKFFGK